MTKFVAKSVVTPFDTVGIVTAVKIAILGPREVENKLYSGHVDEKKYFPDACLLVAGSDKSIRCYDAHTRSLVHVWHAVHGGSAVRAIMYLTTGYVLSGGMDGRLVLTDMETGKCAGSVKAHSRLVNAMDYSPDFGLVVSGGYDGWVVVYKVNQDTKTRKVELTKVAHYKFMQIPTIVKITKLPHTKQPVVLVCVQDSTYLNYLSIPNHTKIDAAEELATQFSSLSMAQPSIFGTQANDVPPLSIISRTNLLDSINTSTFVTFTPMALDIYHSKEGDSDDSKFVVATSHSPYMRVIVGEIGLEEPQGNNPALTGNTAHEHTTAINALLNPKNETESKDKALVTNKGEDDGSNTAVGRQASNTNPFVEKKKPYGTMIFHNILAHAPQDQYSMPKVKWSHSGTGVWVSGDDGLVRGIEVETGKVVVELGGADTLEDKETSDDSLTNKFTKKHLDKIRDIDVGQIPTGPDGKTQDIVVTGGVDKRVFEFFV